MANDEYYIVYKSILPEYFESVINAKSMVEDEKQSVSNACKKFNISRSTYYKYKDKIFTASKSYGRKCIFGIRAGDKKGVLSAVIAEFYEDHLDFTPLGDVISSVVTLIQGHPDTDFYFKHSTEENTVELDTRELREILEGVPLNSYEVIKWIEDYLKEQYDGPHEE